MNRIRTLHALPLLDAVQLDAVQYELMVRSLHGKPPCAYTVTPLSTGGFYENRAVALGAIFFALILTDNGGWTAEVPFPATIQTALEAALTETMAKNVIPGVVVGIWIPGERIWLTTRGVADTATSQAMSLSDHFRIGSNTKTFTVTAIL